MKFARLFGCWSGGLKNGQPLARTHPHLLKHASELMPGIGASELKGRRERLMKELGPNSIAVIPSYRAQYSSQNILYSSFSLFLVIDSSKTIMCST